MIKGLGEFNRAGTSAAVRSSASQLEVDVAGVNPNLMTPTDPQPVASM
jgi:hypothetical protein